MAFSSFFVTFASMDVQFWIWLAIIAVSFIARALKKKPEDSPSSSGQPRQEPLGPVSFEELLKEIQAAKTPKPKVEQVKKEEEFVDYREVARQQQIVFEKTVPEYVPSIYTNDVYEKAKADAFLRPSLEETMKLEDTVVRYNRFKGYKKEEGKEGLNYLENLFEKEKLKQAFVLNEVLMRKF